MVNQNAALVPEAMGPDHGGGALMQSATVVQQIAKAEYESQIDVARRNPRSIGKFLSDLEGLVTIRREIAERMFYTLKRRNNRTGEDKAIQGKSIRFAEAAATAYTNLRYGGRIVHVGDQFVTVRGACLDLERNVGVEIDIQRRITTRDGARFSDDMINVTSNAAISIAIRNAVLHVIPTAFTDPAYEAARKVAIGDAKTLKDRRLQMLDRFAQMNVTREQVLEHVERATIEDVTLGDLEDLIGTFNAIKDGDATIDEVFAPKKKALDMPKTVAETGAGTAGAGNVAITRSADAPPPAPPAPAPPKREPIGEVIERGGTGEKAATVGEIAKTDPALAADLENASKAVERAASPTGELPSERAMREASETPEWQEAAERARAAQAKAGTPAPDPAPAAPAPNGKPKVDRNAVYEALKAKGRERHRSPVAILSDLTEGKTSLAQLDEPEAVKVAKELGVITKEEASAILRALGFGK